MQYFTFGNDQWISFDDKTTLKQKTDWASSVGVGGSLIWASDLGESIRHYVLSNDFTSLFNV